MKNQNKDVSPKNQQKKPKRKKKGKIAKVYRFHQKGLSVKEIAAKMKLKESLVRRAHNPPKIPFLCEQVIFLV